MIYFVKSPDGPIKIGTTIRLSDRIRQLAVEHGEPLEVIAVMDGSFAIESELHRRFSHLRLSGEWFKPGDDLIGFMVAEATSWDGRDEKPRYDPSLTTVKVERSIVAKARYVAAIRDITLAEMISELLRPIVDREFAKASKGASDA